MAPSTAQPITFIVWGQEQAGATVAAARGAAPPSLPAGLAQGRLKQSVRVGARRGGGDKVRVEAIPGEDVVVLRIAGGPSLVLHPENARDLVLAQSDLPSSRGAGGSAPVGPNEVEVSAQLQWRGLEQPFATRGATRGLGDVLLSGLDVITGLFKDPAVDFVASKVVAGVDAQVNPGVYALQRDTLPNLKENGTALTEVPDGTAGAPLLVLIHGTFSTTAGTFSKLWTEHPQYVGTLFERYNGRVYGLDHPTLGASPIANALTLARALPNNARLHLVTHSRGGLVAEVMARVCANPDITAADLSFFPGDDYRHERENLSALAAAAKDKAIRVERVVRVACPARGTLLASERLDAYLSVFKWTLELAGIPVVPALLDFLNEVARRRANPAEVPGLAAQIPNSPLIKWLHAADAPIRGDLRVIAGDIEGDSVTSWLKTLLADSFFWTDNDLVVQTSSMYGGAPRAEGASFVLDQGGKVSHFNYFANDITAEAIVNALVQDKPPQSFRVIGPLSWAGQSSTGVRAAPPAAEAKAASERPAVFMLPGILGSNLKVNGDRIWLSWRLVNGLSRLEYKSGAPDGVEPDGPIGMVYDDLVQFLAATHEVIEYAFDWRRPMEEEARRLATMVDAALAARNKSGQPVRLLAHSMGGLVARAMQLESPEVWQRMMSRTGARLLMLGTPNAGSWAPMQVLSGDDSFGNLLTVLGAPFQDHQARQLMADLPGFMQLQAGLLDPTLALDQSSTWQKLADDDLTRIREHSWWHSSPIQLGANAWGVPSQDVLKRAVALRRRLDAQVQQDLDKFKDKLVLVVGESKFTPDGYKVDNDGLAYLDIPDAGDGRVTWMSARLPGVPTWRVDCEHGKLPEKKEAFQAYFELLDKGTTSDGVLTSLAEASTARGAAAPSTVVHVPSRPSRLPPTARPPGSIDDVFALGSGQTDDGRASSTTALHVTVVNSDLRFVEQPILIGHYQSLALTGTEFLVDKLVGGAMKTSLEAGLYPGSPGVHQIFVNTVNRDNPLQPPRPRAAIIVGLGAEGKLTASDLMHTVTQGVIAWAQRVAERPPGPPADFELAATLIGSGGTGIAAGQAARLVAEGVRLANDRLEDCGWPRVGHLYLVELYLDRAVDAWRALQVQATAAPARYVITDTVKAGMGALPRLPDSGYRGTDYDLISVTTQRDSSGDPVIAYTLDTKRARSEVRAQALQGPLIRALVASAFNDQSQDKQTGRTLFQLLVPIEMEPFFGGTTEMLIELDNGTAGIPWELIDTRVGGSGETQPWAVRAKLVRKLRTVDFRERVVDADADGSALVIGEPKCDAIYPRLPGARAEAMAVAARLGAPDGIKPDKLKAIFSDDPAKPGPDALTVMNALLEREWRIVHIAGHGEPPELKGPVTPDPEEQKYGDPRGVVLSDKTFLGPREIRNMRVVPELVFVNCCHLAARDPTQFLRDDTSPFYRPYDRARFASGVAAELIKIGVRCVVAAGWAVNDEAAKSFAMAFYDAILNRHRFIDAVAEARKAAFSHDGNTWGAYQCYGDPNWTFKTKVADPQRPSARPGKEFSGIAAPQSLILALETLATKSKSADAPIESQREKIRHLEAHFATQWGGQGAVAEAFGKAWAAARDSASAIRWYEKALTANDGGASIKASEQLGNHKARVAWETVAQAIRNFEDLKKQRAAGTAPPDVAARIAESEAAIPNTATEARKAIAEAIALLDKLVALHPTMERHSLCGSAYKRQAMIAAASGKPQVEKRAIEHMKKHYKEAEELGRAGQLADIFYPVLNYVAADLVLNSGHPDWAGLDAGAVAAARQNLAAKCRDDPDFWSVVGTTELVVYEALADKNLADKLPAIKADYENLHTRVDAPWLWSSVYDQMHFVLAKYKVKASAAEQRAADELLSLLQSFAAGPKSS